MSTVIVSPLRQRMIEDMNARKLCAGTAPPTSPPSGPSSRPPKSTAGTLSMPSPKTRKA
jgi:hypothetical protein